LSPCFCTLYSNNSPLLITIRDYITTRCNNRLAYLVITGCTIVVQVIWLMIKVSLFVSAKTQLKIKERQILSKMHFKPQGSSAVVELHKLTLIWLKMAALSMALLLLLCTVPGIARPSVASGLGNLTRPKHVAPPDLSRDHPPEPCCHPKCNWRECYTWKQKPCPCCKGCFILPKLFIPQPGTGMCKYPPFMFHHMCWDGRPKEEKWTKARCLKMKTFRTGFGPFKKVIRKEVPCHDGRMGDFVGTYLCPSTATTPRPTRDPTVSCKLKKECSGDGECFECTDRCWIRGPGYTCYRLPTTTTRGRRRRTRPATTTTVEPFYTKMVTSAAATTSPTVAISVLLVGAISTLICIF